MEVSAGARPTGWQGAYIPQLKYRNPVPTDDAITPASPHNPGNASPRPSGTTIRDIRLSMSQGQTERQNQSPPKSLMPPSVESYSKTPPRKKSSLFGSLFATKEPTQIALNQVAAQMKAQHGTNRVPNVSMEKMPQHVPKVNAKWDGVPDSVKQREKWEKDRARIANRESMTSSTVRSRSSERRDRPSESRGSHNSVDSQDSRSRSLHSRSRKHESYRPNPHRFYAQSVNSSGDLAAQQRPEDDSRPSSAFSQPPSLKTASSKSLADAGVVPDDIPPPPKVPAHHKRGGSQAKDPHREQSSKAPPVDAVPGQTRSPAVTPREGSPVTPQPQNREFESPVHIAQMRRDELSLASSGPDVLPLPVVKAAAKPNPAFLAGEAQEFQLPNDNEQDDVTHRADSMSAPSRPVALEKRPDSSRDRLGLRANMTVKNGHRWDQDATVYQDRPTSADDHTNAQLKPKKTMSKAFGSFLKREM